MPGTSDKLPATAVIWVALACILIFAPIPEFNITWLTLVLALAATGSTLAIWLGGSRTPQVAQTHMEARAEKGKRTGRVTRLMDLLDEDEIDDLEAWMEAHRDQRLTDEALRHAGR